MDDDEIREMEERDEFLNSADGGHLLLKVDVAAPFKLTKASGVITLLEVRTRMYGWGGCGNCLGASARILLVVSGRKEEMVVGPQPRIFRHGDLRMALGTADVDNGTAVLFIKDG
jgi:hypothetical protein